MSRWKACNILHLAPDAKRLWQFEAKGKGFVLGREHRVPHAERLPGKLVAKSWSALWHPRLNMAWLPPEAVFIRMVELPASSADETFSMVELQLEKFSPMPVTQMVWTMHVLGTHQGAAKADGTAESLQMVAVVMVARAVVDDLLGRLERDGFLADRLEAPMLDQLEAVKPEENSVWFFPLTMAGQNAALVGWWYGGAWRNLSLVTVPPAGNRAGDLKTQISLLAMAGEVEGWYTGQPRWHLVADPVNATEWEQLLRAGLNEPVQVMAPPTPADLAGRSAVRTAAYEAKVPLLPVEYTARYREQFFDRLWLHGLGYLGVAYALGLVVYFSLATWMQHKAEGVESQVAAISVDFTNSVQLQAKLAKLQERANLKFAALECWQAVAQELPAAVTLQRWSFADGHRLVLSGQVDASEMQKIQDFYQALRKVKVQDHLLFKTGGNDGDLPSTRIQNNVAIWSLSLELETEEGLK